MELSLDVPSDLEYVGPAVELIADELPGGPLSPRRIRFNFRTAFAEALANAIAYGNHRDPGRVVRVRVEVARDPVRLHVPDEGNGFAPPGVPHPTLPHAPQVAAELSERYEEIALIYTISEILGHTIRLDEAADRILREVSTVVGARRATLLVYDAEQKMLRIVAARGMDPQEVEPIEADDPCSVAARVFREMRIVSYDPTDPTAPNPGCPEGRNYRGQAFLSVPVLYAAPGARGKPIGVINLTDRVGGDAFTAGDRKLVAAIANQIGAAIENARLVARDLGQQRVLRELELARDLQLKLLPSPLVVASRVDVAARCRQAESVGGDFYNLLNLRAERIGVMIGDVTSHGFGAALIMALVMAASGIHAESAETPTEVLRRLEESLADELASTEMFLTVFYAVVDPKAGRITFANAGHPHAFLVSTRTGEAVRLEATRPPLGLAHAPGKDAMQRSGRGREP